MTPHEERDRWEERWFTRYQVDNALEWARIDMEDRLEGRPSNSERIVRVVGILTDVSDQLTKLIRERIADDARVRHRP